MNSFFFPNKSLSTQVGGGFRYGDRLKRKRRKHHKIHITNQLGLSFYPCSHPNPLNKNNIWKKTTSRTTDQNIDQKRMKRKTFQIKFSCFYLGTTTKKIPLATINWQIRNWLCGSGAGIFQWHQLLCHYCGWPKSEWGRWTAGSWLGLHPWPRSTPVQAYMVRLPSELRLSPGSGNPCWLHKLLSNKIENLPASAPTPTQFC